MKKVIVFGMLLIITATSFSQQTKPAPTLIKEDYLKKSKTQKIFAWILAGTGVGLVVTAFATYSVEDAASTLFLQDNSALNTSATLLAIGGIAAVSSIPLFIASGKNKRKGMSLSFKNEPIQQIQKRSLVDRYVPSLALNISL